MHEALHDARRLLRLAVRRDLCLTRLRCRSGNALLLATLLTAASALLPGQAASSGSSAQQLPDAPRPQVPAQPQKAVAPCKAAGSKTAAVTTPVTKGSSAQTGSGNIAQQPPCPHVPVIDWFARFLNGPEVKPLTPKEKARLAVRNVVDPFNGLTILGDAGISVASDSHSAFGPGMPGFGRYVGVSFTQDMTGEFFGTFLIPSITRQDPHYHRMPSASIPRRIVHAIVQVAWTKGDNDQNMLNYANLVGFGIEDEISNLYVPGRQTNAPATASRYAIGLATAPVDNFVTEFVPDVARHIHVHVVLVQRIIDQVAKAEGGGPSAP